MGVESRCSELSRAVTASAWLDEGELRSTAPHGCPCLEARTILCLLSLPVSLPASVRHWVVGAGVTSWVRQFSHLA